MLVEMVKCIPVGFYVYHMPHELRPPVIPLSHYCSESPHNLTFGKHEKNNATVGGGALLSESYRSGGLFSEPCRGGGL